MADAISRHWPEQWSANGWKTQKQKEVKNACLWSDILLLLEEGGHLLRAEGRHEYSELMRYRLPLLAAYQDFFSEVNRAYRVSPPSVVSSYSAIRGGGSWGAPFAFFALIRYITLPFPFAGPRRLVPM